MKRKLCLLLLFCFSLTAPALQAQQKATPKSGEGISSFLLRRSRAPKKYYDDFIELNKARLDKSRTLKMGVTCLIPPVKKASDTIPERESETGSTHRSKRTEVNEPLFGEWLANTRVTSDHLAGVCLYVVSGHGGPNPSAIGRVDKHEFHEGEYAYDIALRLARNPMQEGAEVRVVIQDVQDGIRDKAYPSNNKRETCMGSPISLDQVQRLQQRCSRISTLYRKGHKKFRYCQAIFIHVDSRSKSTQTDVFFYHSDRKTESEHFARNVKATFESEYGKHQPSRGFSGTISGRNLYILAHTTPASVFAELGNIQNTLDQRRLMIPSNRQTLAKWLMEGLMKDYK